jgi:hypothetical protein
MKNILLLLVSLLLLGTNSFADEVNPDGKDAWKSLVVTIKQLDIKKLPTLDGYQARITIQFGGWKEIVETKDIEMGKDFVKKMTIPKADDGRYYVSYGPVYGDSINLSTTILSGNVKAGTESVEGHLKRIDVHHMNVVREDGTTYVTTKGTANLKYFNGEIYHPMSQIYTGYGLDVPVGFKYKVEVSAETEDGIDSYVADLDFTKM